MAKYILRRLGFMLLTMLIVSIAIFLISEAAPGDVARHILGQFASPEQVELLREQMGLTQPLHIRYIDQGSLERGPDSAALPATTRNRMGR